MTSALRPAGLHPYVLVATGISMLGPLVPFLLGALAVVLRVELGLSSSDVGFAIGFFFVASALSSIPAGRFIGVVGAARAARMAGLLNSLALLAMATVVSGRTGLIATMTVAGVGNAVAHPAVNALVGDLVETGRHGWALGLKQAAIPGAVLVAGLMVPLSLNVASWEVLMAALSAIGIGLACVVPRGVGGVTAASRSLSREPTLLLLGLASAAGIAMMNGGATFLVAYGVERGWTSEMSGWLLAAGSVLGMGTRVAVGSLADRTGSDPLRLVAVMLVVGAVGALGMVGVFPWAVVLMCAAGWGWPGLMHLAVLRKYATNPAAATGVVEVGTYLGGGLGPAVFGVVVDRASFDVAWIGMGCAGLAAGLVSWAALRTPAPRP